jgi:hypothetical protein
MELISLVENQDTKKSGQAILVAQPLHVAGDDTVNPGVWLVPSLKICRRLQEWGPRWHRKVATNRNRRRTGLQADNSTQILGIYSSGVCLVDYGNSPGAIER